MCNELYHAGHKNQVKDNRSNRTLKNTIRKIQKNRKKAEINSIN